MGYGHALEVAFRSSTRRVKWSVSGQSNLSLRHDSDSPKKMGAFTICIAYLTTSFEVSVLFLLPSPDLVTLSP
jgi:hypothetical protein